MECVIAMALLAALVLFFGDILLMLAIRIGMFLLMLWVVCLIQKSVASVLIDSGLITHTAAANLIAFVAVMFLCCSLLHWSSGAASSRVVTDVQAVGLDVFRVGLLLALGAALFITQTAVASGKLLLVSWIWLMILAVFAAGLDVCIPSLLGGTVNLVSPKVTLNHNKGGFHNVS